MIWALALLLALLAAYLLWQANRRRAAMGLPRGRIIYTDTGGWGRLEKPLYDPISGLTGKPDYLVELGGGKIAPVEVKSTSAPAEPYESHLYQLAAYCLLVERTYGVRPPYGLLHYRNRTFQVDYTPELEAHLHTLLEEMHALERRASLDRSHDQPKRCARCGYRDTCDQRL